LISVAKVAIFCYLRKEKSSKLSANVPAIVSNFCNRLQENLVFIGMMMFKNKILVSQHLAYEDYRIHYDSESFYD